MDEPEFFQKEKGKGGYLVFRIFQIYLFIYFSTGNHVTLLFREKVFCQSLYNRSFKKLTLSQFSHLLSKFEPFFSPLGAAGYPVQLPAQKINEFQQKKKKKRMKNYGVLFRNDPTIKYTCRKNADIFCDVSPKERNKMANFRRQCFRIMKQSLWPSM